VVYVSINDLMDLDRPDVPTPRFRDALAEMLEWLVGNIRVVDSDGEAMVGQIRMAESDLARAKDLIGIYRGQGGPAPAEVAAIYRAGGLRLPAFLQPAARRRRRMA
jgi:hypothetical protein